MKLQALPVTTLPLERSALPQLGLKFKLRTSPTNQKNRHLNSCGVFYAFVSAFLIQRCRQIGLDGIASSVVAFLALTSVPHGRQGLVIGLEQVGHVQLGMSNCRFRMSLLGRRPVT